MTRTMSTLLWLLVSVLAIRLGLAAALPFADTTEPRYAEIARIMAETGDWLTPWFAYGVPFWGQPPLSFWTQAPSFYLLGAPEFARRPPPWPGRGRTGAWRSRMETRVSALVARACAVR